MPGINGFLGWTGEKLDYLCRFRIDEPNLEKQKIIFILLTIEVLLHRIFPVGNRFWNFLDISKLVLTIFVKNLASTEKSWKKVNKTQFSLLWWIFLCGLNLYLNLSICLNCISLRDKDRADTIITFQPPHHTTRNFLTADEVF